jgi:hypothetical protein
MLPPNRKRATPKPFTERLPVKALMVATAMLLGCLVIVQAEFYASKPGTSLSEVEADMRIAQR